MLRKLRTHATAGLLAGLALAACGGPEGDPSAPGPGADDLDDLRGVEEIGGSLTQIADVTFSAASNTATVRLEDDDTAVISLRAVDKMVMVNGFAVPADGTTKAIDTNVKNLVIAGAAGATGTVTAILDFANGTFAKGGATTGGIVVDFTGVTGVFKVRGKKTADTITVGKVAAGEVKIALDTTDRYKDILVKNAPTAFTFSLGAGNDTLNASNLGADDVATFGTGTGPSDIALTVYGGVGTDTLIGGSGIDTIHGNEDADTIKGEAGADLLFGDEGNDTFDEGTASNGGDVFDGGADTDTVTYASRGDGPVTVVIGAGALDGFTGENDDVQGTVEVVTGTPGADSLTAAAGGSTLNGGAGVDTLIGAAGNDTLNGDADGDNLFGAGGNDNVNGGDGDDTLLGHSGGSDDAGADIYDGGNGTDTLTHAGRAAGVLVVIDGTTASGGSVTDGVSAEGDKVKTTVENLIGTAQADTLTGSSSANVITGDLGNDVLNGGAGDDLFPSPTADGGDTIIGGTGTDTVDYSARAVAMTHVSMDGTALVAATQGGGEGENIRDDVENLYCPDGVGLAAASVCTVTGNANANLIEGGPGPDVLSGGAGDDEIYGGDGDDDLFGEAGDDTLDGGDDSAVSPAPDEDALDCGAGSGDIGFNGVDGTGSCEL